MHLLLSAWVCVFKGKVNWVAAVVPETTGFVIAVTFLTSLLHTPGNGEGGSVCCVGGWWEGLDMRSSFFEKVLQLPL